MAITINQIFKTFSGVRNPMLMKLETDNYVQTAGTAQVLDVADATPRIAGQTMTLQIGDEQCVITYDATPDSKLNEVRPYIDAGTFASFISDLNALPFINRYFTVSGTYGAAPQHIVFTQTEPDEATQISIVTWTASTYVNMAASDVVYRDNFRMVVELFGQADRSAIPGSALKLGTIDAIPDADGLANIDVSKVLRGALLPDVPADTTGAKYLCTQMYLNMWLQYREKYGIPAVAYTPIRLGEADDYFGIVRGGMRWKDWDADTVNDDYFDAAQNKFLTNMPDGIAVSESQPLWLYFYNNTTRSLRLNVTAHFSDSSTDQFTVYPGAENAGSMLRFAVGYTQLSLESNVTIPANHRIVYYTVLVETNTGTQVSELRTFNVDAGAAAQNFIVFENRWGAMDTLWCRGWYGTGAVSEGNEAVGIDDPEYAAVEGPMGSYGTRARDSYSWDTGFKNKTELEWLRELADSDYTYFVEDGKLVKCVIDRGAFASMYGTILPPNGLSISFVRANFS